MTATVLLSARRSKAQTRTIRLLFTSNTNGKLVDCNCRNDPYGGLAERVSLVTEYRAEHGDIVLVDSGGYFGLSESAGRGGLILSLMRRMGYDAVGVGDQELYQGLDTFLDRYDQNRDLMVNASLRTTAGEPVFEPSRVVTVQGMRIGIIGLVSPKTFRFFPEEKRDFTVADPDEILRELLPEFRESCDAVVVLSQMGYDRDRELAEAHRGITLIVGGHSQTLLEEADMVGGTAIVQAGKNGGRVGEVLLNRDDTGTVTVTAHRLIPVTDAYEIPRDVRTELERYNISIPE